MFPEELDVSARVFPPQLSFVNDHIPPVTIMTLPERSGMSFAGSNDLPPKSPNMIDDS